MFKAVLQDVSLLRDSLDAISSIITEGTFEVSKDGLKLVAMDPASVAMVICKILPSAFVDFDAKESFNMTMNISNFVGIIKRAKVNDKVTLESDGSKLKVYMDGDFKRHFTVPLVDMVSTNQKIPELSFKSKVIISSDVLRDGIKDAQMVSDCVIFETTPQTFVIKAQGDMSETKMELTSNSPSLLGIHISPDAVNRNIQSKYAIEYLEKMLKGIKVADDISLQFSNDYPLRIDYTAIDKLQLSFILAPRVDTD